MAGAPVLHPWETPEDSLLHAWELSDIDDSDVDSGDDEASRPENDTAQATTQFLDILLGMYFGGHLSAEKVCTLCYFAHFGRHGRASQEVWIET
jgi:hypothetical protein